METVRIFDRAFGQIGVCGDYTRLEYTEAFREVGTAELTVPGSSGAAGLFVPDGYIGVPGGELYRIISVERDHRAGELRVECEGLLSLLGGTAIPEEYTIAGNASALMYSLIRRGAGNLPAVLRLGDVADAETVSFASGRSYLYDDLVSLCWLGDLGMSLRYTDGGLVFSALAKRDRTAGSAEPVVISRKLGTFDSERLRWDLGSYRNVAVVSGAEKESGGRYTATVRSDSINISDPFPDSDYFDRQMLVQFSAPLSGYTSVNDAGERVFDEAAYTAAMIASGAAALGRCRPKLYLYGRADSPGISPGDLVDVCDPDSGITAPAVAERVTTVYSENSVTTRTELCARVTG